MDKPLHYILHIPKTAGSSLKEIIFRKYNSKQRAVIYSPKALKKGFTDQEELTVIMGHYRYGFHRFSNRKAHYYTILRNPIEHVISNYYFIQANSEESESTLENVHSIIDFVKSGQGYNLQTRFISGIDNLAKDPERTLYLAKVNLVKEFEVIGIMEEFEKSILLMGKKLGWKHLLYVKQNKAKNKQKRTPPSQEELETIKQLLKYDIELYAFAKMLFNAQLNKNRDIPSLERSHHFKNILFRALNPFYLQFKKLTGSVESWKAD